MYITASGRQASGYIVEALDRSAKLKLPTLIECDNVPNNTDEIATPEVVVGHPHLVNIAKDIPPLNESADVITNWKRSTKCTSCYRPEDR